MLNILILIGTGLLALSNNPLRSDQFDDLQHPQPSEDRNQQPSFAFQNVQTKLCLDVLPTGKVVVAGCNKGYNQQWQQYFTIGGGLTLKHRITKKCLEMSLSGEVSIKDCRSQTDPEDRPQIWDLPASLFIRNVRTNLCINEKGTGEGCYPQNNMRWTRL